MMSENSLVARLARTQKPLAMWANYKTHDINALREQILFTLNSLNYELFFFEMKESLKNDFSIFTAIGRQDSSLHLTPSLKGEHDREKFYTYRMMNRFRNYRSLLNKSVALLVIDGPDLYLFKHQEYIGQEALIMNVVKINKKHKKEMHKAINGLLACSGDKNV